MQELLVMNYNRHLSQFFAGHGQFFLGSSNFQNSKHIKLELEP